MTYFHVELERHAVLLAEGLPAESFLDTGNRGAFSNAPGPVMLSPDFSRNVWAAQGCAPLCTAGAEAAAMRADLMRRAEDLGWQLVRDPDLRVRAGGRTLRARRAGEAWDVALPAGTRQVRFASRAVVPAHLGDGPGDRRRLGVALADIRLDGELADTPARVEGWHAAEEGWQWTDGDAALATGGAARLAFRLVMSEVYWEPPTPRRALRRA